MTTPRSAQPPAPQPDVADATAQHASMPEAAAGVVIGATDPIDPAVLRRAAHDLRSPLTVLVCNRRFLEDILAKAGIDDPELREILEDDGVALARLEAAVAALDALGRRSG